MAVSRAKACLLIVGCKEQALNSDSDRLKKLAEQQMRKPRILSQSPGEEKLYNALLTKGLSPVQQYPLVGRYLDLALVEEKLDIEVDGAAWHLNKYGERKADDVYRDLQVQSCGWRVIRFWHNEVMQDVDGCVQRVVETIDSL